MDVSTFSKIEKKAQKISGSDFTKLGIAMFFMVFVLIFSFSVSHNAPNSIFLSIASIFGAYMAMNIGANDVANNVGPAVGSKALTMGGAIAIAAIFEASGALIAGADVVKTIKKGIIDLSAFGGNVDIFIWAMMSALLAAALWLNLATYLKAPVSTTHSIVGGVMGAGIASAGFTIVNWGTMGKIVASWVISPVLGGLIAAGFLYAIKKTVLYTDDRVASAKKWVPVYVAIMSWAFVTYLVLKGFKHTYNSLATFVNVHIADILPLTKKPSFLVAALSGVFIALLVYIILKAMLAKKSNSINGDKESINALFTVPLIFAAALLSFAHGANDVANAVGPLAAINEAVMSAKVSTKAGIPLWVMALGGIGISLGLALYGPKLIKTVGGEITQLNQIRAFCIAIAAAITVIIASQLGLPVSSTHIAVGGVFGVGFLREWLDKNKRFESKIERKEDTIEESKLKLRAYQKDLEKLEAKEQKKKKDYEQIIKLYQMIEELEDQIKNAQKKIKKIVKYEYVKRDMLKKIVAAWLITVPVAALIAAMIFYMMRGMLL